MTIKRALVTGGAGFIGSHVADALLAEGYAVTVLDSLTSGKREQVPAGATFIEADIRSAEAAACVRDGQFDLLCHLAAQMDVRRSVADPSFDADVNIRGTLNLLEAVRASGRATRVIFASTGGAVYGDFVAPPTVETDGKDPESPYGVAKFAVELYLAYHARVHGLDYVALRFSNVFGPRQDPHGEAGVVAIFAEKLLRGEQPVINGDGKQTRDYLFVGDLVRANLAALTSAYCGAVNLGTGIETDVNVLFGHLRVLCGATASEQHGPAKAGEQQRSVFDNRLAQRVLGWTPAVRLEDGLRQTVEYFRTRLAGKA
jgi:UDP-glucose 4-epimerase